MPRADYKKCKDCKGRADVVGALSHERLCSACSARLLEENMDGIHTRSGLPYARWQIGMAMATFRDPAIVNALFQAGAFAIAPGALDAAVDEPPSTA